MNIFKRANRLSAAQGRALACCAVPILQTEGAKFIRTFGISKAKGKVEYRNKLMSDLNILNEKEAETVVSNFASGRVHEPLISEIFTNIIKERQYEIVRGIFSPLKQNDLHNLDLPSNFKNVWADSTNSANEDIGAFMDFLSSTDQNSTFHKITSSSLLNRLNKAIKGYENTFRALIVFGYSQEELMVLSDFKAWDLGRCGYIGRIAANNNLIGTNEVWDYMLKAAVCAAKSYHGWRAFLAAYFLGCGIACPDIKIGDFRDGINFLLKNNKSPYRKYPLHTDLSNVTPD